MRRILVFAVLSLFCLGATRVALAQARGTIKLLSKNDITTVTLGDGSQQIYATVSSTRFAKYLIVGPVTVQVDYRLHLPPDWQKGAETFLTVYIANSPYKRFKISPRLSSSDELEMEGLTPSAPMGFYLPLGPGAHVVEFRPELGPVEGASIQVVDSANAYRQLSKPPPEPPTDNPAMTNTATPVNDTNTATENVDAPAGVAFEVVDKGSFEYRNWAVGAYAGALMPLTDDGVLVGALSGVFLQRRLVSGLQIRLGAGFAFAQESRPGDEATAVTPTLITLQTIPVTGSLSYYLPIPGRVQPYVIATAGAAFVTSRLEQIQIETKESAVGLWASGGLGIEVDVGLDFDASAESAQKIFVQLAGTFASAEFDAHDLDSLVGVGLLAGAVYRW